MTVTYHKSEEEAFDLLAWFGEDADTNTEEGTDKVKAVDTVIAINADSALGFSK